MTTPRSRWSAGLSRSTGLVTASSISAWSSSLPKRISGTCSSRFQAQDRCAGYSPTRSPRKTEGSIPSFSSSPGHSLNFRSLALSHLRVPLIPWIGERSDPRAGRRAIPFVSRYDLPMTNRVKRIGLISDTHGLLRTEAVQALRGSELIIHAGDVGSPRFWRS